MKVAQADRRRRAVWDYEGYHDRVKRGNEDSKDSMGEAIIPSIFLAEFGQYILYNRHFSANFLDGFFPASILTTLSTYHLQGIQRPIFSLFVVSI